MLETIQRNNLPNKLFVTYDANGVFSKQKNYFKENGNNSTKWISDNEFEFSGFIKIIAFLTPRVFQNKFIST